MRRFDYNFLDNGMIPSNLLNIACEISTVKTIVDHRRNMFDKLLLGLEKISKVQSVKSSNAIENIIASDDRINMIVNHNSSPLNHNEAEIAGYKDALNFIHLNYKNLNITEDLILKLHRTLMSYTTYNFGGTYKTEDNVIIEQDIYGNKKIRFKPISAKETNKAMEQLCLAYNEAKDNPNINKLLLIPCFILDFLCIHPFRDGNGRMSRLLTLLLLYKAGFDVVRYISFEEQINNSKNMYYESLKESSYYWEDNKNNYFPFIDNFMMTLFFCYKELDKRFGIVNSKKISKKTRIENTVLNSLLPISKREICDILVDISPSTVEMVLGKMVSEDKIVKIGSGRNIRYSKKN